MLLRIDHPLIHNRNNFVHAISELKATILNMHSSMAMLHVPAVYVCKSRHVTPLVNVIIRCVTKTVLKKFQLHGKQLFDLLHRTG